MPLSLYTDGTETYIAESAEEARAMQVALVSELDASPLDEWTVIDDDKPLGINLDDSFNDGSGDANGVLMLTPAEWIARNGRGFLCSKEY